MNLSVNNVSFNGKKEVLYGIKNAAKSAYEAEISRSYAFGPRPEHREGMIAKSMGKLEAYADMAVKDDAFVSTIKEAGENKTLMADLGKTLVPVRKNYGEISPINVFKKAMTEAAENTSDNSIISACQDFLGKLNSAVSKL